jgi:hypothetical protein
VVADATWDVVRVAFDDARRNADVLGVCAVIEQQILAEVLEATAAEETLVARGGIRRHDPITNGELRDTLAHRDYITGQLVPKHSGGDDHAGMVAAAKHFDIGSARQRYLYPDENVSVIDCRNSYRLYLQVLLAVKHGSHHLVIHYDHLCG